MISEHDEFETCQACSGSGEGSYDGSSCKECEGLGEVPVFDPNANYGGTD